MPACVPEMNGRTQSGSSSKFGARSTLEEEVDACDAMAVVMADARVRR